MRRYRVREGSPLELAIGLVMMGGWMAILFMVANSVYGG